MERLTKTEYAAKSACITFKANDGGEFRLIWTPSKQWGHTAKTEHRGRRTGFASGCEYDKQSAVIADFLRFLVPECHQNGGAGLNSIQNTLLKHGWRLSQTYNGKSEEGYILSREA
jgi:hypothetical protein